MAFSVDTGNISNSGPKTDSANPQTWTHVCGAGVNKLVVTSHTGNPSPATAISYNGVALTKIKLQQDSGFESAEIWYLDNPASGSHTVSVSMSSGAPQFFGTATGLIDAATGAGGTPNGSFGSTANPTLAIACAVGDIVIGAYASDIGDQGGTSAGATTETGTLIGEAEDVSADSDFSAQYYTAASTSQNISWTAAAVGSGEWAICGVAFSAASGGSNTTITPSAGSLTLTGVAPVATRQNTITPTAGALTLTPQTAGVIRGSIIIPATGAMTLTGPPPVLIAGTGITPSAGALTLTGVAPAVSRQDTITPSAGTLVLTGVAPMVTVPGGVTITPNTGSLVLTGTAPVLIQGAVLVPLAGALVFSGVSPVISTFGNITPQPGALSLTGFAPSILRADTITPGTGALVFSGTQAGVSLGTMRTPITGALVLNGIAPSVTQQPTVSPSAGALTFTGYAPVVTTTASYVIVPGTGSLVLNGQSLQGSLVPVGAASILLVPARTAVFK